MEERRELAASTSPASSGEGGALRRWKAIHFKLVTASQRLREELNRSPGGLDASQGDVVAALAGEFKAVLEEGSSSVRESVAVQKVLRDFEAALKKAEAMLKETRRRQGQHAARVRVVAASPQTTAQTTHAVPTHAVPTHAVPTQQTQAVHTLHHELEANEAVIRDRDAALAQISSQIGDVHQIFVDLAGLVSDQGGQVDDIESNIERAKQRTEDGIGQIRRAERKGKRARCNVFFMTGLAGMAVLVLMIVVLA